MCKKMQPCRQEQKAETKTQNFINGEAEVRVTKNKLLLHSCCGPCSTACIERLRDIYKITIFFYNPNITDREEYEKRKAAQLKFIDMYNRTLPEEDKIDFIEGEYLPEEFYNAA